MNGELDRMKKLFTLMVVGLAAGLLVYTNPRRKQDYVDFVADNAQRLFCQQSQAGNCERICEAFSPITAQIFRGVIYLYTDRPKNYWLFSVFTSKLPGFEIHAIGIGDRYFVWPINATPPQICQLLESRHQPAPTTICATPENPASFHPLRSQPDHLLLQTPAESPINAWS